QLLEKVFVPLFLFAVLVLYAMSCIVIVAPNEQAVIEHFGNPVETAGPGLAFKWPWPIDIAYKYPTEKIAEINIGFEPELDQHGHVSVRPLLWGQKHHHEEHYLLVASEQTAASSVASAVPVSLIIAAVPVHYKIKDLHSYIYNHEQPEKLLEAICYRELTRFAASAKIEVDSESIETDESSQSLLGAGRTRAKNVLTERIQTAADDTGLGVEIVFVGLQGIHPPTEVAPDYQQVVGAAQKKQAQILWAMAHRNSALTSLAGSVDEADLLYRLAAEYQQAKDKNQTEKAEELGSELDRAFSSANGDIFKTLREAQSYAFEKAILAEATGRRFASQQQAYNAAKEIYLQQQRLTTFEEALEKVRKFVVVADTNDTQVFIVDVQEKLTPSLYEMSGLQENTRK
ncbi:MAG: SPFH domain-containing protein, partial [Planctomycetota bacterium]